MARCWKDGWETNSNVNGFSKTYLPCSSIQPLSIAWSRMIFLRTHTLRQANQDTKIQKWVRSNNYNLRRLLGIGWSNTYLVSEFCATICVQVIWFLEHSTLRNKTCWFYHFELRKRWSWYDNFRKNLPSSQFNAATKIPEIPGLTTSGPAHQSWCENNGLEHGLPLFKTLPFLCWDPGGFLKSMIGFISLNSGDWHTPDEAPRFVKLSSSIDIEFLVEQSLFDLLKKW